MMTAIQSTHKRERGPRWEKGGSGALPGFGRGKTQCYSCQFERALREKIVGQDEAVQALVDIYQVFCAGVSTFSAAPDGSAVF